VDTTFCNNDGAVKEVIADEDEEYGVNIGMMHSTWRIGMFPLWFGQ
jgi:hypothetical protein